MNESVKTKALELFKRYSDKHLSITDCTSFVLMESNEIQLYAGFDSHFEQMGMLEIFSQNPPDNG